MKAAKQIVESLLAEVGDVDMSVLGFLARVKEVALKVEKEDTNEGGMSVVCIQGTMYAENPGSLKMFLNQGVRVFKLQHRLISIDTHYERPFGAQPKEDDAQICDFKICFKALRPHDMAFAESSF